MRTAALVSLLLLIAGCTPARPAPKSTPGGAAPAATVERFLRLAAEKEYAEMGWIFGTKEGSVMMRDPAGEVERRMYALGTVLVNDRYSLRDEAAVPGRAGEAIRVMVRIEHRGRVHDVPFTTVRGPENRWYIEQIDVVAVTNTK